MAVALTLAQLRNLASGLRVGQRFTIEWSTFEDPDTRHSWSCVVQSVNAESASATFTSEDADDVEEAWDFPDVDEDDGGLQYHYWKVTTAPAREKRGMGSSIKKSLLRSTVVAWKKSSWLPLLSEGHLGREIVVAEVFRQLNIPDRMQAASFSQTSEHERCVLGEVVLGVIGLLQRLPPEQQELPEVDQILNPALGRLCEHRAGDGKTGKERTEAMDRVRETWQREEHKGDKVTQVMLGLKPGK